MSTSDAAHLLPASKASLAADDGAPLPVHSARFSVVDDDAESMGVVDDSHSNNNNDAVDLQQKKNLSESDDDDAVDDAVDVVFNDPLHAIVRRCESLKIPFTEYLISPEVYFYIVLLAFVLPFAYTVLHPLLNVKPPRSAFFDSCDIKVNATNRSANQSNVTLPLPTYVDCLACNNHSNVLRDDEHVSLFRLFRPTDSGYVYYICYAVLMTLISYRGIVKRAERNETLLCYGILIEPQWLKMHIFLVVSLGALYAATAFYLAMLSKSLADRFNGRLKMNSGTGICAAGVFEGMRVTPFFNDENESIQRGSDFLNPIFVITNFLPFTPVLYTIARSLLVPFKSLTAESILGNTAATVAPTKSKSKLLSKSQQQQHAFVKVREADFVSAVEQYAEQPGGIGLGGCWTRAFAPRPLTFAVLWGATVEDVAAVMRIVMETRRARRKRTSCSGGGGGEQVVAEEAPAAPAAAAAAAAADV